MWVKWAAVGVAISSAACGVAGAGGSQLPTAQVRAAATHAAGEPQSGLPACVSAELGVRRGPSRAAMNHDATEIVFTDRGTSRCTLSGVPAAVVLRDAAGRMVTAYQVALTDGGSIPTARNGGVVLAPLPPAGSIVTDARPGEAFLLVKTSGLMCGTVAVASVEVRLRDGGSFRVPLKITPDAAPDCMRSARVEVSSYQPAGVL